jgi:CBS domain-containing protein
LKIKKLLANKKDKILTVTPDASVYDALKIMEKEESDALVVVKKEKVLGILSKGDLSRKVILKRKKAKRTTVREAMTSNVAHVTPYQKVRDCLSLMMKNRLSHVPVLKKNRLVGLLSIDDIQKLTSQDRREKTKKTG